MALKYVASPSDFNDMNQRYANKPPYIRQTTGQTYKESRSI